MFSTPCDQDGVCNVRTFHRGFTFYDAVRVIGLGNSQHAVARLVRNEPNAKKSGITLCKKKKALIHALVGGDKTIIQGQVLSMFTRPVS